MGKYIFIFDIGNVLINFNLSMLIKKISENSEITYNQLWNDWKPDLLVKVESGEIDQNEFYTQFANSIKLEWSFDELVFNWSNIYTINKFGWKIFYSLVKRDQKIYILSNLAQFNVKAIEMKYPRFFSYSVSNFFSFELGFSKPNPIIYKKVLSIIDQPPEHCFFFDDSIENVKGALKAGINAIHFIPRYYPKIKELISDILNNNNTNYQAI